MKLAGEKERSFSCNKMKIFEIIHVRISMAIFLPIPLTKTLSKCSSSNKNDFCKDVILLQLYVLTKSEKKVTRYLKSSVANVGCE